MDCSQLSTAQKIQVYMGGRNPNYSEAMKLIIISFPIDLDSANVSYDPNQADDGYTDIKTGKVTMGGDSMRSPGFLTATLFHESVHVAQNESDPEKMARYFNGGNADGTDPVGDAGFYLSELQAYDSQLKLAKEGAFNLTEDELRDIQNKRDFYYTRGVRWHPVLDYLVSQGIYSLDGVTESCLINPSVPGCLPYTAEGNE